MMMNKIIDRGCDCCIGDKPLYYTDDNNCAFVGANEYGEGELMAVIDGNVLKFKVNNCPFCGNIIISES